MTKSKNCEVAFGNKNDQGADVTLKHTRKQHKYHTYKKHIEKNTSIG
jgi:hypothetical protein